MTDEFTPSDAARALERWHRAIADENADATPAYIHDEIRSEVDSIEAVYRYYSTTTYTHADARRRWFNDNRPNIQRLPRMPRDEEHTTMFSAVREIYNINTAAATAPVPQFEQEPAAHQIQLMAQALGARLCIRLQRMHVSDGNSIFVGFVSDDLRLFEFDTEFGMVGALSNDVTVGVTGPFLPFAEMNLESTRAWLLTQDSRRIILPQE